MHDDDYETSDLALAAALIEQGYNLSHVDTSNPRAAFIFVSSPELDISVARYWQEKLTVNPKSYFDTIRHLKSRIYEGH